MKQQLTYDETLEILRLFYYDCVRFWSNEQPSFKDGRHFTEDECIALSMQDIVRIQTNPFIPKGEPLDPKAKEYYLADGGWYSYYKNVYQSIIDRIREHHQSRQSSPS